jgi:hypothetical protein
MYSFNMEVDVNTWLFIGSAFGAVLLAAVLCGLSRKLRGVGSQYIDPTEQKRRLDQHTNEVGHIRAYQRGPDGGVGLS